MRKWSPRRRKHWLKVASVEGRDVGLAAREELGATVRECEGVLTAARSGNVDQALTPPAEIDAQDGSALMPWHALEDLTAPLASYGNEYAFRLIREWKGAAAFSIRHAKVPPPNAATTERRREEALSQCIVVWTERGLVEAANWWMARCFSAAHKSPVAEGSVQDIAITSSWAGDAETRGREFARRLAELMSRAYPDVNAAALPFVLTMEPHWKFNAWSFGASKREWLWRMVTGFAFALMGDGVARETLWLPGGVSYEGQHLNGRPHGRGQLQEGDGVVFHGRFRHGKKHGVGSTRHPDGMSFIMKWWHGAVYGETALWEPNGRVRTLPAFGPRVFLRSLLANVSVEAYKRLIIGVVFGIPLTVGVWFFWSDAQGHQQAKGEWLAWLSVCELPPGAADAVAGVLVDVAGTPEFAVLYSPFDGAVQGNRADYLARSLRIALGSVEGEGFGAVAADCARQVDLAMVEYKAWLDATSAQVLGQLCESDSGSPTCRNLETPDLTAPRAGGRDR